MSVPERRQGHEAFRELLLLVLGQAFGAAGYTLQHTPMQWAGGRFRFARPLQPGVTGAIDFQVLIYTETGYAARQPSRFRVTLSRLAAASASHTASRTLAALVVEDFGVAILPDADHWWTFRDAPSLGRALAEAGHLVVGYGIPWLDGSLTPPAP